MGYINIFVGNQAYINIKNNQVFLKNSEKQIDYPLEDINSIMIENQNGNISYYALAKFAEKGVLVFICDEKHLPCGVLLPFCQHYNLLSNYNFQSNASKPLLKQLWQNIITNKISNQNDVLNICGGKDSLKKLAESVLSGDSNNVEATASLIYFKELFNGDFKRRNDDEIINSFLNYGYAIIRGFVARSIVSHGLMPFLGINHSNQFNQYNLADDLMEPFRPIVDLFVKIRLDNETKMTSQIKKLIYNIINIDVEIDGKIQTLSNAIEMYVESFLNCLKNNKKTLKRIKIIGLDIHKYE